MTDINAVPQDVLVGEEVVVTKDRGNVVVGVLTTPKLMMDWIHNHILRGKKDENDI